MEQKPNYILLDAAAMDAYMDWLKMKTPKTAYVSLYKGSAEEDLSSVAPYLFELDKEVFDFYTLYGKGNSWGVLLGSAWSFEQLKKHFRRFLMVKDEAGKQMYFRFYDPRVLRIFLPTCTKEQLMLFFGAIDFFVIEDEDADFVLLFSRQKEVFKKERLAFEEMVS
jgi:hypothetical protein